MSRKMLPVLIVVLLASLAVAQSGPRPATRPASRPTSRPAPAELSGAIDKGIELIEAQKLDEACELFISAKDLAWLKDHDQWEQMLKNFKERRATEVLAMLKAVKGQNCFVSEDGQLAWFTIKGKGTPPFYLADGKWCIK